MQQPLFTDAVLTNAPSRMTILSPTRCSDNNCRRLLRSTTVNQRHATVQHSLNKQLLHELKNAFGFEASGDV